MTEAEREELIEKMIECIHEIRLFQNTNAEMARAALAVAEPVIREQCARIALRKKKQKYYDSNSVGWEGEWEEVIEFPQEGEKIAAAIREGGT